MQKPLNIQFYTYNAFFFPKSFREYLSLRAKTYVKFELLFFHTERTTYYLHRLRIPVQQSIHHRPSVHPVSAENTLL